MVILFLGQRRELCDNARRTLAIGAIRKTTSPSGQFQTFLLSIAPWTMFSLPTDTGGAQGVLIQKMLEEFNESWLKYWATYVELQNQLYESARAAREVSWLAATDEAKLSQINRMQRELYSTMPRRVDYMPLGGVNRTMNAALSKLNELETALTSEKAKCLRLEAAVDLLLEQIGRTKQELKAAES